MGLTDWKPTFRVTVDGEDITSLLASRLVSLRVNDAAGVDSDTVEFTLSDHLPFQRLRIPPTGAEIRVALGYQFAAKDMGLFIADSVEASGPPHQLRVRGTASVHGQTTGGKSALTEQKTRSWDAGTTISTLIATIAGEHGLEPGVSQSLGNVALPHVDQIDESDINLLTRIARDYDAIAKPGGGRLVMAKRGESATISGEPMPAISLTESQVTTWTWRRSLRAAAGQVVATYRDQSAAADIEVTAGDGTPVRRLRQRYPDQESAQAAANAEYQRSLRAGTQLSITLPGNPDLIAEGRVALTGFRPGVDGEWLVTRVVHSIDAGGYRCAVTAETP